jgi:hypothetical protein
VKKHLTGEDADPRGGAMKNLRRLYIWTDGHSSTYKGYPNFGRMGYWPLKNLERKEAVSQNKLINI